MILRYTSIKVRHDGLPCHTFCYIKIDLNKLITKQVPHYDYLDCDVSFCYDDTEICLTDFRICTVYIKKKEHKKKLNI